ncbi:MAG: hypothetical protein J6M05_00970 [Cardiobacteriaceae bacterium]|nr:hypothetical protein [Cardiobacteriaceae bacterium]
MYLFAKQIRRFFTRRIFLFSPSIYVSSVILSAAKNPAATVIQSVRKTSSFVRHTDTQQQQNSSIRGRN